MPKNSHKFHENEKVLCFHGPLLYEAKVQKSREKENKETKERVVDYFVHYLGWSKNWDEWVPEDRVLKITDLALQKQKELIEAQNKGNKLLKSAKKKLIDPKDKEVMSPNVSIGFDKPKPKPTNALGLATLPAISCETKENSIVLKEIEGQRKKRIKVETTLDSEVIISSRGPDVQIKIPESLKQCLVDDCDLMGLKKLVRLPSKVSVNRIVEDYVKHQLNTRLSPSKESAVREGAEAIKVYFNASIGTQLLYPFEKIQFKDLIKESDDDSKASAIYGGIHLLRLFVKLGSLLSYLNLDEKSSHLIVDHIHDFLKYLERNPSLFTANEYESASAEYLKKSS